MESTPAFNEVRLTDEEQDAILIQLSEYLLDENLVNLAQQCLGYVADKSNFDASVC